MIKVFITNISTKKNAKDVIRNLGIYLPGSKITVDLADTDKVLRIEGPFFRTADIANCVRFLGYSCKELGDE